MALTDSSGSEKTPGTREGAPAWVVPAYVGGLVVLYIGERVVGTLDTVHWIVSGLGLGAVLAATAARFVPTWQAGGERGRIEKLLGILSIIGVVALGLYACTTDYGLDKLGLLTAPDQKREAAQGLLTIAWVVLVCVSVFPMLFAEAALYPQRNAERLESRRVGAAAAAGLTIALALVYSAFFVYSATGSDWKIDFSYFKTSEPSESTRKLVEGLNEPVRVVAFFPEVNPVRSEVKNYLTKLADGAKNMHVEFHDRYLSPKIAKEMKIVQDGVVVIEKGDAKRMIVLGTDIKDAEKGLKTLDRDFQERLLKLLRERRNIYLTVGHGEINDEERAGGPDAQKAGRGAQILKMLLGKQNYTVKDLGLTQGLAVDVPSDADVVMVLGPTEPFAPEELSALDRYAKRGGKLLMALDPDAISADDVDPDEASSTEGEKQKPGAADSAAKPSPGGTPSEKAGKPVDAKTAEKKSDEKTAEKKSDEKPGASAASASAEVPAQIGAGKGLVGSLEALAGIVGVKFDPTVLVNDKEFARRRYNDSDKTLLVTNRFSSHPSVSTLSRNASRAAIVVAGSGSVERLPNSPEKVDIAVRGLSSTFKDVNRNYRFDRGPERRDAYGIAAAVTLPVASAAVPKPEAPSPLDKKEGIHVVPEPPEMRAFVIADADVLTDLAMSNFMANQVLVMDALRWLGGEESFAGEVNNEEDVPIEHTQQKDLVWFYATIFGAPALVLGLGLTYSRRSRQRRGGKKS